jgi:glycosyltransferase involved in cell wall biosynthesis
MTVETQELPLLSLILPAYNGASYIADNVRVVAKALETLDEQGWELIVVCDGSTDGTAAAAMAVDHPRVVVVRNEVNLGKGEAVLQGARHAHGRLIAWLDADLDIGPGAILDGVSAMSSGKFDAVTGSKRHADSEVSYPLIRRVYSMGFQVLVRLLFRINVRDTQVGAKVFRREMIDTVAPLLLVKRYAFDLEVLAVGAEFGFDRIGEVPVTLTYRFTGTGINSAAVRRMFVDTMAIAYRIHLRHHYVRQFAAVQRQRMDARTGAAHVEQLVA